MEVPEQKMSNFKAGAERLAGWIADQVRFGLADLERDPRERLEAIATQLTDAQLPGPAAALRDWIPRVGGDEDWAEGLLRELGYWHLQCRLMAKADALGPELRAGLLVNFGHRVRADALTAGEPSHADTWTCVGIEAGESKNVYFRRVYWRGTRPDHAAVQVAYQYGAPPPPTQTAVGTAGEFGVHAYPGGMPARVALPASIAVARAERCPHAHATWLEQERWQEGVMARQPWRRAFPVALALAAVEYGEGRVSLADRLGRVVRVRADADDAPSWRLLALGGGAEGVAVFGEWRRGALSLRAAWAGGAMHDLRS